MRVGIVGTGYVGLVTGVCLAVKGHRVTCFDVQPEIVASLNRGQPHIVEKSLAELLRQVLADGHFEAKLAAPESLQGLDLILVAVGTPSQEGRIDLSYIRAASTLIGSSLNGQTRQVSVVV